MKTSFRNTREWENFVATIEEKNPSARRALFSNGVVSDGLIMRIPAKIIKKEAAEGEYSVIRLVRNGSGLRCWLCDEKGSFRQHIFPEKKREILKHVLA